jgi:hypothetical protein
MALLVLAAMSAPVAAQDATWPREVPVRGGSLIVYQPQPEGLNGNELSGRAAAQYAPDDGEPIFGTLWSTSRVDADKEAGTALVRDITVTRARWPDVTDAHHASGHTQQPPTGHTTGALGRAARLREPGARSEPCGGRRATEGCQGEAVRATRRVTHHRRTSSGSQCASAVVRRSG